jgi:uncharacterized protein with PIN domain
MIQEETLAHNMKCPQCGVEMTFHAEKVVYSDVPSTNSIFEGQIEEIHSCPGCGRTEARTAGRV